jgi:hypothetical protein
VVYNLAVNLYSFRKSLLSKNLPLIAEVFLQADTGSIRLWLYLRKNLIMQGVQRLSSRPGYLSIK